MPRFFLDLRRLACCLLLLSPGLSEAAALEAAFSSATDIPLSTGSYDATGNTVNLSLGFAPPVGTTLTIVQVTGSTAIEGRFDNLAQGQTVDLEHEGVRYPFVANYAGGNGNDLILEWGSTRAVAWGNNNEKQSGTGVDNGGPLLLPALVDDSAIPLDRGIRAIATGRSHVIALCTDGSLAAWGLNHAGSLGDGTRIDRRTPVVVPRTGALAGRTVIEVAAGTFHSLALCSDGTIAAWGSNSSGQLGDGSTVDKLSPVSVDRSGILSGKKVVAIAAGANFNIALCDDGTLAAWGDGSSGQLGNGSNTTTSLVPLAVTRSGVLAGKRPIAIEAGTDFAITLCDDGTLAGWGENSWGQLGFGFGTSQLVPALTDRSGVLAGKRVVQVSAGGSFVLARASDGTLAAWGNNFAGMVGDGSTSIRRVPVLVNQTGVLSGKQVAAVQGGLYHSIVLCTDGTVAAWGYNTYGQLGDNSTTSRPLPVLVGNTTLPTGGRVIGIGDGSTCNTSFAIVATLPAPESTTSVATAISDAAALLSGSVRPNGQATSVWFEFGLTPVLGSTLSAEPATVDGGGLKSVTRSLSGLRPGTTYHYRVVSSGPGGVSRGEISTFTTTTRATLAGLTPSAGRLGPDFEPVTTDYWLSVPSATSSIAFTPVVARTGATVTVGGTPVTSGTTSPPLPLIAGNNTIPIIVTGEDGGTLTYHVVVTRIPASLTFTSPDQATMSACGLDASGPLALSLGFAPPVGSNLTVLENTGAGFIRGSFDSLAHGQQVTLDHAGISYPFVVNYFGGDGNDLVLQWANTRVMGWGSNLVGQVGNAGGQSFWPTGITDSSGILAGKTVIALAAGANHSLALCSDGTLAAWGSNSAGQLGSGSPYSNSTIPVAVDQTGDLAGKTVIAVAAGKSHSLVLCSDGTLAAWGANELSQLGGHDQTLSRTPVMLDKPGFLAGRRVIAIAAKGSHNLALCDDGVIGAWGDNSSGQLGDGSIQTRTSPIRVGDASVLQGRKVVTIAAGDLHSLALCDDGTLFAWGENSQRQLGDGSITDRWSPVQLQAIGPLAGKRISELSAGGNFSMALCTDGTIAAWGSNSNGQLGNATNTNSSLPVEVSRSGLLAGKTVVAIESALFSAMARCSDGTLATWGSDSSFLLGDGPFATIDKNVPVLVSTVNLAATDRFVGLAAGYTHALTIAAAPAPPAVSTMEATVTGDRSATLHASVRANGSDSSISFEYGTSPAYGTTLAANPSTIPTATAAEVEAVVTGLEGGTTYHYRAVAKGAGGISYGKDRTFTTGNDSGLASLALETASLSPSFATGLTGYSTTVPPSTTRLVLNAHALSASATIAVNGTPRGAGSISVPVDLMPGANTLDVLVSSSSGSATRSYRIEVVRIPATITFRDDKEPPLSMEQFTGTFPAPAFALGFAPMPGTSLRVLEQSGRLPFTGFFEGLAQGQRIELVHDGMTYRFVANYHGGDGNDLVLEWANRRIVGWGLNSIGCLGHPDPSDKLVPVATTAHDFPDDWIPLQIESSGTGGHTLALGSDGTVWAWGRNDFGQLGEGSNTNSNRPMPVDRSGLLAGKRVIRIAAGGNHSLALCHDGTLLGWGEARFGQLGTGDTEIRSTPVPVAVNQRGVLAGKTIIDISAGLRTSYAVCSDGTVASWGSNGYGALGSNQHPDIFNIYLPQAVDLSGVLKGKTVVDLEAGEEFCLAICSDGTLAAWGSNSGGALGNNSSVPRPVPVLVNTSGVLAGKKVTRAACGRAHVIALCDDGTVAAWGTGSYGVVGDGTLSQNRVPVAITARGDLAGKTVIAVDASTNNSLALCSDASAAAWGRNSFGQLGNNSRTDSSLPVVVQRGVILPGERLIAVTAGSGFQLAIAASPPAPVAETLAATTITDSGAILNGRSGANGSGTALTFEYGLTDSYGSILPAIPPAIAGSGLAEVRAEVSGLKPGTTYHYRVIARNAAGTATGQNRTFTTGTISTLAGLSLDRDTLSPAFSPGETAYSVTLPFGVPSIAITPVAATPAATITLDGSALASGSSSPPLALALGENRFTLTVEAPGGAPLDYTIRVTRLPEVFAFDSPGDTGSVAASFGLDGLAASFSLGYLPARGASLTVLENTGTDPIGDRFSNLRQGELIHLDHDGISYRFVANYHGGDGNDLVLQSADVRLVGWGNNGSGQLGNGVSSYATVPSDLEINVISDGVPLLAAAAGLQHSLVLTSAGEIHSWGSNSYGRLGRPAYRGDPTPRPVDRTGVLAGREMIAIAAGTNHSLALFDDGKVASWGRNDSGQLGIPGPDRPAPGMVDHTGVLTGKRVVRISSGNAHSLALCSDGTLVSWGLNTSGQLGNKRNVNSFAPVRVDNSGVLAGKRVTHIATGKDFSMVLCSDGTLAGWGSNATGQLGINSSEPFKTLPVPPVMDGALAGKTVTAIAAGGTHALVLCSDGTAVAWGDNTTGALGDGSITSRLAPVTVSKGGIPAGVSLAKVTAGDGFSVALTASGTAFAWGKNNTGQLGNNTIVQATVPTAVQNTGVFQGESFISAVSGSVSSSTLALISQPPLPEVMNLPVEAITATGATLNGRVFPNGNQVAISFEYGLTPDYGTQVAATPSSASGKDPVTASATLQGLVSGATYHYRLNAAAPLMTVFTKEGTFTTPADASLASLSLDPGTLQPEFSPAQLEYWATLPPAASSIRIVASPAQSGAIVSINGSSSGIVAVPPGNSTVTVEVAAPSGTPRQSYQIHLTRLPETILFSSVDDVPISTPRLAPTGRSVHFRLGFAPSPGTRFTVVENTGTGWIGGEFTDLNQGQIVNLEFEGRTYRFAANYFGGDGNDLVLEWGANRLFSWGFVDPQSLLPAPANLSRLISRSPIIDVAGGSLHRVILHADGSVFAWGANLNGELGNGTDTYTSLPVSVDRSGVLKDKQVIRVAAGNTHSLALCSDGSVAAWGSSLNLDGSHLGPADTSSFVYSPILVPVQHLAPGKAVIGVAAGDRTSHAWFEDGTIASWGSNNYAQLGNNSVVGSSDPVRVYSEGALAGKRVTSVAAGEHHVAALCSDGTVACWGRGDNGQLGNNSTAHRAIPVAVSTAGILAGKTVVQLAAGRNFTLALCSDGTIAGWGANNLGQLGTGASNAINPLPLAVDRSGVLAGKTVTAIAAGQFHAWAICSDGSIAAWGYGNDGQLGVGNKSTLTRPVLSSLANLLPGERFTQVASAALSRSSHALTALDGFPLMTDLKADPVGNSTATLGGIIHPDGLTGTIHFEYGTDENFGFSVEASPPSASGTGDIPASAQISGLRPGTTYRFRVRFVTGQGIHLSDEQTFTAATDATLASLETSAGPLSPGFHPAATRYALSVPFGTPSIALLATPAAPGASVTVNGVPSSNPVALTPGANDLLVEVTAPDSGETFRYLLDVTRLPEVLRFDSPSHAPLVVREFAATLPLPALELGFPPLPGTQLTLIRNIGGNPVHGRFPGLPQGGSIDIEHGGTAYRFLANYHGGDGNDLVLQWANSRLFGWGENATAQLGNGYRDASLVPTLAGIGGPLTSDPVLVAGAGGTHSLTLTTAGSLATWGSGLKGLLGIGSSPTDTAVPVSVNTGGALGGKNVVAVRPGRDFNMVLCDDGSLAAWGSNAAGQLGLERNVSYSGPQMVMPRGALAGRSVASVATGTDFTLALCTDGTLVAWGLNTSGQLGNNGLPALNIPVPVVRDGALAGKTVSAITTGASHSLVLCEDGSLFAWGLNADGQLGDGSKVTRLSPVAVDRSGILAGKQVTAIAAGDHHSFALCSDGTVAAWGRNTNGQLGDNQLVSRNRPVAVDVTGILGGKSVVSLIAGADHTLAACSDGTLVGWGRNHRGQLGDGTLSGRLSPVEVSTLTLRPGERLMPMPGSHGGTHTLMLAGAPLASATTLAARDITGTAATLEGSVQANRNTVAVSFEYGLDATYGKTTAALPATASGVGTTAASARLSGLQPGTTYHYRAVVEGIGGIVRGEDRTFTTLSDNALLAALTVNEGVIGPDFDPQVTTYHVSVPAATGSVTVNPMTAHPRATAEVQGATAGNVTLAGQRTTVTITVTAEDLETLKPYTIVVTRLPETFVLDEDGDAPLSADGFSASGYPVILTLNQAPLPGAILKVIDNTGRDFIHGTFSNLARGQRVALAFDGLEYDFVANYHGGDGNDLVLQWANTGAFAWGLNSHGQLGDGSTTRRLSPVATDETGVLSGKTITAISGGYLHSLALCSDGSVATWGFNAQGQLGNGSTTTRSTPVEVDLSDAAGEVVAISAGPFHNLALRADGRIAAWGYNNYGQLGTGDQVTYLRPVLVPAAGALAGKKVVAVAAGAYHSFALCSDGSVAAWGYNDEGELGDGTTVSSPVPVAVDTSGILAGKSVARIAAGQYHLLALCTDGTLVSWGYNARGQLGNGATTDARSPVAVDLSGALSGKSVVDLAAGESHSLVRCSDRSLLAWGNNLRFQLGTGSTLASSVPVTVDLSFIPSGTSATSVSSGRNHNLIRLSNGSIAAWGENSGGQLGNLGTTAAARPAMVELSGTPSGSRAMLTVSGSAAQHSLAVLGLPGSRPATPDPLLAALAGNHGLDSDHDGIPDLLELAFGLDPQVPHDGTLPQPQLVDGRLGVSFPRPASGHNFIYGAECSESLEPGSWKTVPDSGSGTWHEFKLPAGPAPRMFMRLTVQPASR
jgi:alpha-tubulin suppressor-like RCC1 family protein/phosphodiesterase/alkaline phosphatase D-like protein